jgi:hypothetical protein
VILFSGGAITVFKENIFWVVFLAINIFMILRYSIKNSPFTNKALKYFSLYFIISTIVFNQIHPIFFIKYVTLITTYNILRSIFSFSIFYYYERIIYALSVLSLVLFFFENIARFIFQYLSNFIDLNSGESSNFLIYTMHYRSAIEPRNCGFAWEPGPFSVFVFVSLLAYLIQNKAPKVKKLIIYGVTILSTQSEAGIALLCIWFLIYFLSKYNVSKRIILVFIGSFLIYTTNVSKGFIDKYESEKEQFNNFDINSRDLSSKGYGVRGYGRSVSLLYIFEDFKRNPIIGYGGHKAASIRNSPKFDGLNFSTGSVFFAEFGLFGIIVLLLLIYRSSIFLSRMSQKKSMKILWVSTVVITTVSLSIFFSPILFTFLLMNTNDYET